MATLAWPAATSVHLTHSGEATQCLAAKSDETRRQSAVIGLESGALKVEDLTYTNDTLLGTVVSDGSHGYSVTIDWGGVHCGCKDHQHRKVLCKHLIAAMLVDLMQQEVPAAA